MKSFTQLWFWTVALAGVLLYVGCASTSMRMQVLVPAHINVPQEIQMLALVNRYRPEKSEGLLNVLEGAVTGENIGQDRRSAEAALGGLTNALSGSPRFTITRPAVELRGTGRGDFPDPLPVAEVQSICSQSNAQALVTIEAFDSDQSINCTTTLRERKTKTGTVEKYTVWLSKKSINVTVGWRMYDARNGNLVDEFRMVEQVFFNAEGNSEALAIGNLPQGENVTREIGRVTGDRYSQRISPTWVWVNRSYYQRGNDFLKVAKRKVKFNDWKTAEEYWVKGLDDPKPKLQGRAMYNLALAAEMRGDLQAASDKAREAQERYGIRRGGDYFSILQARLMDQARLNEQMNGK
jgi:Family of unknown function (DUF6340)